MKSTKLPSKPLEMLGTHLCQVKGHTFLVLVDYHSRWLEIKLLKKTSSRGVIKHIKYIFSMHGIPEIMISDNGPQYILEEFAKFASRYGYFHSTSTPYFLHSNAETECAVQTAKRIIIQKIS